MRTSLLLLVSILLAYIEVQAQQDAQYSMYMFNGQYINPGYVGSRGAMDISGLYRWQWAGKKFEGAPQSMTLGFNTPFKRDQYAIGLYTGYDHIGYTDMYNLQAQFAYRIKVRKSKIALGVQAGFYHYNNNKTSHVLISPLDNVFAEEDKLFLPNIGAGIYVYGHRYFIGAAIPHILNFTMGSNKFKYAATDSTLTRQYRHWFFTAGMVIGKETSFLKFKPTILIKYVQGVDKKIPDFDINANFLFVDRFWLGAGIRTGGDLDGPYLSDVIGIFECLVTQQFRVGYSYDYVLSDLTKYTGGSHEIMLGYTFGFQKKKFVNVRYGTYF